MTTAPENVRFIARALEERHGCRAAILYGSHARGDATAESDYDVAGFGGVSTVTRIAGKWRDSYLDVFVYPAAKLESADVDLLHLRNGVVLFEEGGEATRLLERLDALFARAPEALSDNELSMRRRWAWKMLDRVKRGDIEGDYRRVWLLMVLLEDYFPLRNLRYAGPKASLAWLASNAPEAHAAFGAALAPQAALAKLEALVEIVAGARSEDGVEEELLAGKR